jgi:cytochrome P450
LEAVLTSPDLGMRPGASPVPDAIAGSPAGDIFGHQIRMRDGEHHAAVRPALVEALDAGDPRALSETAGRPAEPILRGGGTVDLRRLAFEVPATALALAIGVPEAHAGRVVPEVAAFAGGVGAIATPEAVDKGKRGAAELLEFFGPLTARAEPGPVRELARRCPVVDADPAANSRPHRFDPGPAAPRQFTFGAEPHRCPGEAFAVTIPDLRTGA